MKKTIKTEKRTRSNKSTLLAAALVVTAATGLGTYAATDPSNNSNRSNTQFTQELSDEQKAGLEEAREAFQAGDEVKAKTILDGLNLEDMEWRFHIGQEMKSEINDFMANLTDEEREGLKQVHALAEAGKQDEANALLEKLGIQLPEKLEMKLNLTEDQKKALQAAREMKAAGNEEGAKEILKTAGINFPERAFGFHPMMSEEARAALESGNFEAWKTAIANQNPEDKIMEEIDETKFQVMVKVHAAIEAGDFETAKTLAKEAGLKVPMLKGGMEGKMHLMKDLTEEEKIKLKEAHTMMETGNKEGAEAIFEELGLPMKGDFMLKMELNEDQKARLKEAKELMANGNEEEAKAIFDELGLEPPMKGFILNKMQNLTDEQKAGLEKADELRKAGDKEGAKAVMDSLNIPKSKDRMMMWLKEGETKN